MSSPEAMDIQTSLPILPQTRNPELYNELCSLYFAVQVLTREITALRKRVATLEAYNTAHP